MFATHAFNCGSTLLTEASVVLRSQKRNGGEQVGKLAPQLAKYPEVCAIGGDLIRFEDFGATQRDTGYSLTDAQRSDGVMPSAGSMHEWTHSTVSRAPSM